MFLLTSMFCSLSLKTHGNMSSGENLEREREREEMGGDVQSHSHEAQERVQECGQAPNPLWGSSHSCSSRGVLSESLLLLSSRRPPEVSPHIPGAQSCGRGGMSNVRTVVCPPDETTEP